MIDISTVNGIINQLITRGHHLVYWMRMISFQWDRCRLRCRDVGEPRGDLVETKWTKCCRMRDRSPSTIWEGKNYILYIILYILNKYIYDIYIYILYYNIIYYIYYNIIYISYYIIYIILYIIIYM